MLTEERIERYARHILLREVGGVGQSRLLSSRVHLRGLGTVGEWAAAYLALAGVGSLVLEDPRPVDPRETGPLCGPAPEAGIGAGTGALGRPRSDGLLDTSPTATGGSRAQVLAGLLPAFNGDPHYEVVEGPPWDDPTLAFSATLGDEKVLEVRLGGDRFVLEWLASGEAQSCPVCVQEWVGTGDGEAVPVHPLTALAGSLAAGEIVGKLLGIGSVPQGRRWFAGGLPAPAPVCLHG